jgi:D-inositol-3-phosphate glycosyltransferase
VSGVLVDDHLPSTWARVVHDLLADPQRRERMSAGGVDHAREFGWSTTAARLLELYRTL